MFISLDDTSIQSITPLKRGNVNMVSSEMKENVKQRALHPTLDRGTSSRLHEASCSPSSGRNHAQCHDLISALQTATPQHSRGYMKIESISEESAFVRERHCRGGDCWKNESLHRALRTQTVTSLACHVEPES